MRSFCACALIALLTTSALAVPVQWPESAGGNGHFYEVVGGWDTPYEGITWTEADAQAQAMSHQGMSGHLLTIANSAEYFFVGSLPEMVCDIIGTAENCWPLHVGGWTVVTEVYDPVPFFGPFVATAPDQWITAEASEIVVGPNAGFSYPVAEVLFFTWSINSDGFGYPAYEPNGQPGPGSAAGFIVEYDGLVPGHYPDDTVATVSSSWGNLKALYR